MNIELLSFNFQPSAFYLQPSTFKSVNGYKKAQQDSSVKCEACLCCNSSKHNIAEREKAKGNPERGT